MSKQALDEEAAWGFPSRMEPRWPAAAALVVALALYISLPPRLVYSPAKFALPVLEIALFIPLVLTEPRTSGMIRKLQRAASLTLIALINAANVLSLALLVNILLRGHVNNGFQLIVSAVPIWLTNVIVFALWYWELDRGGPLARTDPRHRQPDFLFPQMTNPDVAPLGWCPRFIDYLYVSFTNAMAFSPTDTMPLTHWAKMLMAVQSLASLLTIALVAARAVNILNA